MSRLAGLFLVSAAVLLLQLVQTRFFSVMLWHHLTYLVVTFTMLGFAAGGTVLACRARLLEGDVGRRLAACSLLFAGLVVVAYVLVTRQVIVEGADPAAHTTLGIATAAFDYAILVLPMIFAGLVVALALSDAGASVGRAYAYNMVGSAAGCAIYVPALRLFGGEGTVMLACTLAAVAALLFSPRLRLLSGALAVAGLACAVVPDWRPFEVPVAPSKAMSEALRADPTQTVELTRWDPICRLDVIGPRDGNRNRQRTVYQDGDAPTVMPTGPAHETASPLTKEGLAYHLFKDRVPKVLAIGIGGGIDIVHAYAAARARPDAPGVDFTGVEINRTTAGLMQDEYADLTADRYHLPGVSVHVDEGRSWLRRSDERYDIIQMTGTDTYAALSSGSYVMSESYLYTAEAYDDFLGHLTDDGVISVLRFLFDPPRETLRLAAIAVDALARDGATDPAAHVVLLSYAGPRQVIGEREVKLDYSAMLVRKRPFEPDEVAKYRRLATSNPRMELLWGAGGEVTAEGPFSDYFRAVRSGDDDAFRAGYLYNLDPVTDDEPFFFRYHRWSSVLPGAEGAPDGSEYTDIVGGKPIGLILLGTMLGESTLLVALLVLVPLLLFRRTGLAVPGAARWVVYFSGLGAGYMLVEIVAMQRFVLFLGHPGYAITVVLSAFLVFSGMGAAVAGRSADPGVTMRRALVAVVVLIALLAFALPPIFAWALKLGLPWRILLSVLLLAPAAFFMGMPFPSGLALVQVRAKPLVPWAFGVNGGASVVASVASVLIAMAAGFSAAFLVAAACYVASLLVARRAEAAA